ncbi:hypothetical protein [Streptomyces aureocirculatus]|uniref:hypothetical protein n=1 Tax=Streptomyces aureocirculatus TaxID=67275 RepID=UPI0004CBC150|nr:hypothetical protein [Streptomyces aureocirculatus]
MKLWQVTRTDGWGREEYDAVVVRAENEDEALRTVCGGPSRDPALASIQYFDDEPLPGFRLDRSNAKVEVLTSEGPPGVVIGSFNAA